MTINEIIFISITAALLLVPNLRFLYIKMRYVKVLAVCISVNYRHDSDGDEYQPIWQYNYDGATYTSCSSWWGNSKYDIGEKTEIYVCPKKPNRIYTGSAASVLIFTVIVIIMILITCFFNFLFNY